MVYICVFSTHNNSKYPPKHDTSWKFLVPPKTTHQGKTIPSSLLFYWGGRLCVMKKTANMMLSYFTTDLTGPRNNDVHSNPDLREIKQRTCVYELIPEFWPSPLFLSLIGVILIATCVPALSVLIDLTTLPAQTRRPHLVTQSTYKFPGQYKYTNVKENWMVLL